MVPDDVPMFTSLNDAIEFAKDADTIRYNRDDGEFWPVNHAGQVN
jgi:hypothetical protein